MSSIACIGDLQKLAKRHVPKMFYDYADSGSWSETTYQANETDLAAIKFRQRVALDVSKRSTEMSMLGQRLPMPVALAPTGLTGMQRADVRFWQRAQQLILVCPSPFRQCQFVPLKMLLQIVRSHSGFSFM